MGTYRSQSSICRRIQRLPYLRWVSITLVRMRRLSSVSSPDICVITNIGIAHLEALQDKRGHSSGKITHDPGYEKRRLPSVLNGDDDLLCKIESCQRCRFLSFYGTGSDCAFRADNNRTCRDFAELPARSRSKDGAAFDCIWFLYPASTW